MNSNSIKDSIETFASSKDEFAIMLDGAWGTGKTFFLQNVVKPALNKEHEFLYFSVYGFNSLGELTKKLKEKMFISSFDYGGNLVEETSKLLEATKSLLKTVQKKYPSTKLITEATGEYFIDKQLSKNKEKENAAVLVIDDLERMNKNIDKADFLGYVLTNIIECYGYRVIFVGNSKEMQVDGNDFNRTKEKVISRVLPFETDISLIKSDFLDSSKIDFIKSNADWIQDILTSYLQNSNLEMNLRTLQFILNSYSTVEGKFEIFSRENNMEDSKLKPVKQSAFLNLFVVGNEYRRGRVTRDNIQELDKLMNWGWYKGAIKNPSEKDNLSDSIVDEYHTSKEFKEYIFYNQEINRLIFDGIFNASEFFTSWSQYFEKKEDAPGWVNRLKDYLKLNDQELEELQDTVIYDIKKGEAKKLDDILLGMEFLSFFDKEGVLFTKKEFHSTIPKKLEQLVRQSKYLPDAHRLELQYPDAFEDEKFNPQLKEIFNKEYKREKTEKGREFLQAIFNDNIEGYNKIIRDGYRFNIFRELLDNDYLDKVLLIKHNKANMLVSYLEENYLNVYDFKHVYPNELAGVNELYNKVKEYLQKETDEIEKMDKYRLNMLESSLKKIKDELES